MPSPIRTICGQQGRCLTAVLLLGTIVAGVFYGCRNAPVTGRNQVLILPETQENALGIAAYRTVMATEPISTNQKYIEMVRRVGERLANAANRPNFEWEFNVLASQSPNAFALPGGKVAVNEGIMPICQNEAGLAVVMSHEIAHVLARHGGERMSHGLIAEGAEQILKAGTQDKEAEQQKQILAAYGVVSQYGALLPYSRQHESEADSIGLLLMANAGYDPSEAPRFWERFAAAKSNPEVPEFFSTHPSDAERAAALREQLPGANAKYAQVAVKHGLGEPIPGEVVQAGNFTEKPPVPFNPF